MTCKMIYTNTETQVFNTKAFNKEHIKPSA